MIHKVIKYIITSQLIIYVSRVLIGFSIGYSLYLRFPEYELFWTLLSIILVISPEGQDSRRLSIERFKSNLVGSSVGLLCLLLLPINIYAIITGILLTCLICYVFHIINMARVALVALLIILLQPHFSVHEYAPIVRFLSVTLGCVIGLLITVFTSMILRRIKKTYGIPLFKKITNE